MRKLKLEELGRQDLDSYKSINKIPIVIILDSIRSAMNVGSIFRTADAFMIEKIIICGFTACPPHKEITKTAIGATESVDWVYEENIIKAIENLKSHGFTIIGIEQTDSSIMLENYEIDVTKKYAIILGNEVDGVDDNAIAKLDTAIEIPQYGTKHSLNVAVCGGIIIYEFAKPYLSMISKV